MNPFPLYFCPCFIWSVFKTYHHATYRHRFGYVVSLHNPRQWKSKQTAWILLGYTPPEHLPQTYSTSLLRTLLAFLKRFV